MTFLAQETIHKKLLGQELSENELTLFFRGFLENNVADYQVSAFLAAVFLKGMTHKETAQLTKLVTQSGSVFKWPFAKNLLVDKHSTGGVGDKTSLILLPLCLLEGLKVPMIAGRGLGHTGGTLDKLESFPQFSTQRNHQEAEAQLLDFGGFIIGQSDEVAPLDRSLYALRDVTGTIASIPLITASILGKKLASGISHLVMDITFGNGAFMETLTEAENLALEMIKIANECGLKMRCLLTDMDVPLGYACGNTLELLEVRDTLLGKGPGDTTELSLRLAAHMIQMAYPERTLTAIEKKLKGYLTSGQAYAKFNQFVRAQGGDSEYLESPILSPSFPLLYEGDEAYVANIATKTLGNAIVLLGGGRQRVKDVIDFSVGLVLARKIGDKVKRGDPLLHIYAKNKGEAQSAAGFLGGAFQFSVKQPSVKQLIVREII